MRHFHAWLRWGRAFKMNPREFADRTTAHRWAVRQRPNAADRFVRPCEVCPPPARGKKRPKEED